METIMEQMPIVVNALNVGFLQTLKLFFVTLLGGILLGIIEALAKAYLSTQLSNSIVFAVLIVVLLVKPAGLLGKYVPEKV